ncbi:hypothetical protein ACQEVZ_54900 [Dactylosporangium sp. CA-152071]|uniref:hypothetical protein n=1 Tax=Dactylosporangium sp. CA-152071 TaxID=3239933 RepID=UPI003D8F2957
MVMLILLELVRNTYQVNTPHAGRWSTVDELARAARQSIRRFERISCLDALYDVSWASARLLPSLSFLLGQAFAGEAAGERRARPEDVADWLQTIQRRVPIVEDYQQAERLDPDLLVHVLWDERLWPLHPGALNDPERTIEQLRRYAVAADPVLVPVLGFGIADVVTIGLRAMAVQRAFRADRTDRRDGIPGSEDDAQSQPTSGSLIEFCRQVDAEGTPTWLRSPGGLPVDDRLRAAVAWCSRDADDVARSTWMLDGALLVQVQDAVLPVPAVLVLDALATTGTQLMSLAGKTSGATASHLLDVAELAFVSSGRGLATHFVGPVQCARSGRLTGAMFPASRRLVAVQVVVGTNERETAREADRARRRLAAVKVGETLTMDVSAANAARLAPVMTPAGPLMPGATATTAVIAGSTVIRRVVVIDGPWSPPDKIRPGTLLITLDDWRQITASIGGDHEEFWAFLDELAELPGLRMIEGATPSTLWDTFQRQGVLFEPGMRLHQPGPDAADRWGRRAAHDPYEIVLRCVGLPGLGDWPFVAPPVDGCLTVGKTTPYEHAVINADPPLVFVVDADNAEHRQWTQLLGDAVRAGLTELAAAPAGDLASGWRAWASAIPGPIRIGFHAGQLGALQAVKLVFFDGVNVVLGYAPPEHLTVTPSLLHQQLGEALWCLLVTTIAARDQHSTGSQIVNATTAVTDNDDARQAGELFQQAWAQLPVAMAFHRTSSARRPPTRAVAATLSEGAGARARRSITHHLSTRIRLNTPIVELDQALLDPVAAGIVELLRSELAQFAAATALRTAAVAVERLWATRLRTDDDRVLRRAHGFPTDAAVDDEAITNGVATRAADLLTEAIVGHCPAAGLPMDHRDWHRLFNLAGGLVRVIGHRDQARAGVSSDGHADASDRDLPFYLERYIADTRYTHDARQGRALLSATEPGLVSPAEHDGGAFVSWTDIMRERLQASRKSPMHQQATNAALAAEATLTTGFGTGLDEIFAVLALAADWDTGDETAEVRVTELVEAVRSWSGLRPDRLGGAVDLLTLHADVAARITIGGPPSPLGERLSGRPLLQVPGEPGVLLVMPRRVARAGELLLAHVQVASLPWPDAPPAVIRAFKHWEQSEQKAFEADIEREAKAPDRVVIPRLKKERAAKWGITIPGEIDLVVIDADRRRVFVIEAKAGHVATDMERLLYDIIDYHGTPDSGHDRWTGIRSPRSGPYLPKLLNKADAIRRQLEALLSAHYLSSEVDADAWRVIAMVVTPGPIPAAYVPQPLVPFATIDCLSQILADPATPAPGAHVRYT